MFVGDTEDGSGLHHMLWEVVANSLDEHLAGRGNQIDITLHDDDSFSVRDRGQGIPILGNDGKPSNRAWERSIRAFRDRGRATKNGRSRRFEGGDCARCRGWSCVRDLVYGWCRRGGVDRHGEVGQRDAVGEGAELAFDRRAHGRLDGAVVVERHADGEVGVA